VVSAVRHSQPNALTLLVRGYPEVQRVMAAILLEADEIMVKPFDAGRLAELLDEKISTRKPAARADKERVAPLLHRRTNDIVEDWLGNVKKSNQLNYVLSATKSARDVFRNSLKT
jgi:YesN/AraC family two-component response regulator